MKRYFMFLIALFTLLGTASAAEIDTKVKIAVIVPEYYIINSVEHMGHESRVEKIIASKLHHAGYKNTERFEQQPKHFDYRQLSTDTLHQVAEDLNVDILVIGKTKIDSTANNFLDCKANTNIKVYYANTNKLIEVHKTSAGRGTLPYDAIASATDVTGTRLTDYVLRYLGK